jgi:hypothetical protein
VNGLSLVALAVVALWVAALLGFLVAFLVIDWFDRRRIRRLPQRVAPRSCHCWTLGPDGRPKLPDRHSPFCPLYTTERELRERALTNGHG